MSAPPEGLPRLLAGAHADRSPVALREHLARYGPAPRPAGAELIALVESAGLRGLGGAGFPAATKMRAVVASGGRPVVLANAAEAEPLSFKDRALLRLVPHLVLDGAALAAAAVGAGEVVVAGGALEAVGAALKERRRARLDRVEVRLARVPARFVAGEETALVSFLNGGPAKPLFTPPRPFERGVGRRPTLVQNVETLAQLALLARFGADWFRRLGTRAEPGSALVSLSGAVRRRGAYDVAFGTPLRDLLTRAGGAAEPVSAFLVGGYHGSWIAPADAADLTLEDASLRSVGASLGARAIVAFPAGACGIRETERVARYLAGESAGQCGPCVHGLDAVAGALEAIATARPGPSGGEIRRWLGQIEGRGACRHPDGAVRLVKSALSVFADELQRHARGRCTGSRLVLPVPEAA